MSSLIQFLPTESQKCGTTASLPRVGQAFLDIAANGGTGATPTLLFPVLATGDIPFAAGQISNNTCADLQVTLTYLDSADCDSCTTETITLEPLTILVPKNSVFPLPTGLVSAGGFITGTITAGVFTASDVTVAGKVIWYSEYQTGCSDSGCEKLVP